MGIYNAFDVVRVPFPFTDRDVKKRRPALVLSDREAFNAFAGHSVMAMITSSRHSPWPLDYSLVDLDAAGLPAPSVVRFKFFTLDHRLVLGVLGRLSGQDVEGVSHSLRRLMQGAASSVNR